jgi:hypothetical protein
LDDTAVNHSARKPKVFTFSEYDEEDSEEARESIGRGLEESPTLVVEELAVEEIGPMLRLDISEVFSLNVAGTLG